MRVMEIREFGAPEMLVKAERPDPVLPASGSGEILIRVKAAGINRPDVLQRKGHYPVPAGASEVVDTPTFVTLRLHNVCRIQKGLPISRRHPFQKRFSLFGAMSFSGVN